MESASIRRQGPLSALGGALPALAIGDAEVRHVRLRPDGLTLHLGDSPGGFVPWADIREIAVDPPTTWWPHPAVGDTFWPAVEGLLGGGAATDSIPETPTFPVRITTSGFDVVEWPVTTHYLSGYRRRDAKATVRLVEYLVGRPEARVLLAQPTELLDRISSILRTVPPVGR